MTPSAPFILAIDQGTTSTRAILFDSGALPVAYHSVELRQIYPANGWVEHDPEEIWRATVVSCRTRDGRVDLGALLAELFAREVRAVLVEGGGEVHGAFLDAGLVDRVALFAAPLLLGGRRATPVVGGAGRELKSAVRLGGFAVTTMGDDLLIEADVVREPRGA